MSARRSRVPGRPVPTQADGKKKRECQQLKCSHGNRDPRFLRSTTVSIGHSPQRYAVAAAYNGRCRSVARSSDALVSPQAPRQSSEGEIYERVTSTVGRSSPPQPTRRRLIPRLPSIVSASRIVPRLILYILLLSTLLQTAVGSPLSKNPNLTPRQAIPDKFGNTGNSPAPLSNQPPPRPTTITTTPTSSSTTLEISPTSLEPSTSASPLSTQTPLPSPSNNSPFPTTPPAPLTLTAPRPTLTHPAIAAIAAGGFLTLCLLATLAYCAYRRRPSHNIREIAIRRSKLGSRLGFRIFGSEPFSRDGSRAERRGSGGSEGSLRQKETGRNEGNENAWKGRVDGLDKGVISKGNISRPKNLWAGEDGMLGVPKAGFLHYERWGKGEEIGEGRVRGYKVVISGPRPGRPVSAEPLGRLSGMGLGMGYLK
ncbi:hypothetical protein M011DRAFT_480554 [Sporormia fimetaria CBS 119925]|uniref:Uncharacterized protein n=1 Tax=Sporormia fimetaria CBS 119925 TaxID=1340428 RepID=A0A6A6V100_9PLEO|nr:hypothetical protein M011DRAFT_480554 [Sporormia fimetaria CBS 119925]